MMRESHLDSRDEDYFSKLGNVHLHIDGSGDGDGKLNDVEKVLKKIEPGLIPEVVTVPPKLKKIKKGNYISGKQTTLNDDFIRTYNNHNPGSAHDPSLGYFFTIDLTGKEVDLSNSSSEQLASTRCNAIVALRKLLPELVMPKLVVEVEQVIAKINYDGELEKISYSPIKDFLNHEIGEIPLAPTKSYEVHHGFDIPKKNSECLPISLDKLMGLCEKEKVMVGGWFIFDNDKQWLYRSNLFADKKEEAVEIAIKQDEKLRSLLDHRGIKHQLKTVVEQILGVWCF